MVGAGPQGIGMTAAEQLADLDARTTALVARTDAATRQLRKALREARKPWRRQP